MAEEPYKAGAAPRPPCASHVCAIGEAAVERVAGLVVANFGLEAEEPKFKGTMELEEPVIA